MKTTKAFRQNKRVEIAQNARHQLNITHFFSDDLIRLLDDADRCEQLERIAKELADLLTESKVYVGGYRDWTMAEGRLEESIESALARYEEVKGNG